MGGHPGTLGIVSTRPGQARGAGRRWSTATAPRRAARPRYLWVVARRGQLAPAARGVGRPRFLIWQARSTFRASERREGSRLGLLGGALCAGHLLRSMPRSCNLGDGDWPAVQWRKAPLRSDAVLCVAAMRNGKRYCGSSTVFGVMGCERLRRARARRWDWRRTSRHCAARFGMAARRLASQVWVSDRGSAEPPPLSQARTPGGHALRWR